MENTITIKYNEEVRHNGKLFREREVTKNKLDIYQEKYHNPRIDYKVGYIIPSYYTNYVMDDIDKDDISEKISRLERYCIEELQDKHGKEIKLNNFLRAFKKFLKRNNINVRDILPLYYYDYKYPGWDEICLLEKKYNKEEMKSIYIDEYEDVYGYYIIPSDYKGNYKKEIDNELSLLTKFYNGEIYHYQLFNDDGLLLDEGMSYGIEDLKKSLPAEFKDEELSNYIKTEYY